MINKKSIIAIIPARGGSKGVPGKNLKELAGLPLIDHTILFAIDSGVFDRIIISSDADEICSRAKEYNIDAIKRPSHLAEDNSLVVDAIKYTVNVLEQDNFKPDYIFLLEPTSPLRNKTELKAAINALDKGYDSVASLCETATPPSRIWVINDSIVKPLLEEVNPFLPRQKQLVGYRLSGQYYGFKTRLVMEENKILTMDDRFYPLITSPEIAVDIDREVDFIIAEQMIKYLQHQ